MYTPNGTIVRRQTPIFLSPRTIQFSQDPIYHVYSHYGCSSDYIDRCRMCKYLLQPNTYLHPNPQSLINATKRPVLPPIKRQLSPTPIKPIRHRIDNHNDLYLLPKISGTAESRRKAEDTAIINICSKDKSIDRIILIDADEDSHLNDNDPDDDVRYVQLYDLEKRSN